MNFYERRHFFGCLFSHFPPGLQSAVFILHFTPILVCGLHSVYPLSAVCILPSVCFSPGPQSAVRSPQSAGRSLRFTLTVFVFAVSDLYLKWTIWIWCERFVICCGGFVICCERFEFAVSDLNLMWVIWIWCEHFVLMWQLWATMPVRSWSCRKWMVFYQSKNNCFVARFLNTFITQANKCSWDYMYVVPQKYP